MRADGGQNCVPDARAGFQQHSAKPLDPPEFIAAVAELRRQSSSVQK